MASPWLNEHLKGFIKKHIPESVFYDDFDDLPRDAKTVLQLCQGWALNRHFAAVNTAEKALINAYPNSDALARKDYLSRVVEYWAAKRPGSILKTHCPLTICLSLDYAEYVDEALTAASDLSLLYSLEDNENKPPEEREWWILKPALVDCGAGIRLFATTEELASHLELAEDEVDEDVSEEETAGEFNPTLSLPGLDALDGLATAVWSAEPCVAAAGKQARVFRAGGRIPSSEMRSFVAQRYVAAVAPLEGRKWHVRAYALAVGRLWVYVFQTAVAEASLGASLTNTGLQDEGDVAARGSVRDFWATPDDLLPGGWKERVFEQVCGVCSELFRAAAHTMADRFTTLDRCFELFGADFLVDADGTAWLLEVNETPAFYEQGVAGPLALRLMESLVLVTLEHMGVVEGDREENEEVRKRMVEVLDETNTLAKSNITEIVPEV